MRIEETDLLVVGAGPAGLAAAAEAARLGARVVVLDEAPEPGGCLRFQLEQGPDGSLTRAGARDAARLHQEATEAGAAAICGAAVWGLFSEWDAYVTPVDPGLGGDLPDVVRGRAVVAAAGASQKPLGIPGWTLPGVLFPAAVQSLVNRHRVRPGRRAAVIGTDLLAVTAAHHLALAGANVLGVVPPAPGAYVPAMAFEGPALRAAEMWNVRLVRDRIATGVIGTERVNGLTLLPREVPHEPGDRAAETWHLDLVVISGGLTPLVTLVQAAGCPVEHIPGLGGHVPLYGPDLETPLAGVFVAGSMCGAAAARAAEGQGRVAGLSAARHLGLIDGTGAERRLAQAHDDLAAAEAAAPPFVPNMAAGRRRIQEVWRTARA